MSGARDRVTTAVAVRLPTLSIMNRTSSLPATAGGCAPLLDSMPASGGGGLALAVVVLPPHPPKDARSVAARTKPLSDGLVPRIRDTTADALKHDSCPEKA